MIIDSAHFHETYFLLLMVCCSWFWSEGLGFRVSVLVLYAWSGLGRQKCGIKSSKTCVYIFLLDILCFVRIVWCICLLFVVRDIFTKLMFISSTCDFGNVSYGVVSHPTLARKHLYVLSRWNRFGVAVLWAVWRIETLSLLCHPWAYFWFHAQSWRVRSSPVLFASTRPARSISVALLLDVYELVVCKPEYQAAFMSESVLFYHLCFFFSFFCSFLSAFVLNF